MFSHGITQETIVNLALDSHTLSGCTLGMEWIGTRVMGKPMLFRIGAFAQLSRVSVRMLRYYDQIGLLTPAHVDRQNGYRHYTLAQLERLHQICALRDLGFSVEDMALLLHEAEPRTNIHALLQRTHQELAERIAADQARLQRIAARLQSMEHAVHTASTQESIVRILHDAYGLTAESVKPLFTNAEPHIFRVDTQTAGVLHIAVGRADTSASSIYTTWLSGYAGHAMAEFLLSRAGVLAHLEAQQFPAPRLVRTRDGAPLGYGGGWCVLVLTALPAVLTPTIELFQELGATLGRLHQLSPQSADPGLPVGESWFYPEHALHEALYSTRATRTSLPGTWHDLLDRFHMTLETIRTAALPRTVIHGNPFIDTAARTPEGALTLVHWQSGGLGVALLDLGRLLYACHLDPQQAWPWTITPDPGRIRAILSGYTAVRPLSTHEQHLLPEAIRFSIAYGATEHLAGVLSSGWTARLEQKLVARRQWYEACAQIAEIARASIRA